MKEWFTEFEFHNYIGWFIILLIKVTLERVDIATVVRLIRWSLDYSYFWAINNS